MKIIHVYSKELFPFIENEINIRLNEVYFKWFLKILKNCYNFLNLSRIISKDIRIKVK